MFSSIIKIGSTVKPGDVRTIKPDPEGVEIRRLRRLHRFRMLGGKTGHQSLAQKLARIKNPQITQITQIQDVRR
jgi:hypothetical protein